MVFLIVFCVYKEGKKRINPVSGPYSLIFFFILPPSDVLLTTAIATTLGTGFHNIDHIFLLSA